MKFFDKLQQALEEKASLHRDRADELQRGANKLRTRRYNHTMNRENNILKTAKIFKNSMTSESSPLYDDVMKVCGKEIKFYQNYTVKFDIPGVGAKTIKTNFVWAIVEYIGADTKGRVIQPTGDRSQSVEDMKYNALRKIMRELENEKA